MDLLTVLKGMREKLTPPGAWGQGAMARDAEGRSVAPTKPTAVCWCLIGAKRAVLGEDLSGRDLVINSEVNSRIRAATREELSGWNDAEGRTQADVLNLLDAVIANVEQEQAEIAR